MRRIVLALGLLVLAPQAARSITIVPPRWAGVVSATDPSSNTSIGFTFAQMGVPENPRGPQHGPAFL